jgi:ATP-dependent Clp protease, protease subunit
MNGSPPTPTPKDYYLGFNYTLDRQSVSSLIGLVQQAVNLKAKSVTICMSSSGGAPDQALYVYEILKSLPVTIYTHAIGPVQSAAVTLFLSGSRRYASPGANFLFHDTVFNTVATLRYEDMVGHAKSIEFNDKWLHKLISHELRRPAKEVAKWFLGQELRDTQFALEKGLIEEVRPLVVPPDAEFVQVAYKF